MGVVEIQEDGARAKQRIRSEIRRVGLFRFLFDVVPYRIYSRLFDSAKDEKWESGKMRELSGLYPDIPVNTKVLITDSPNSELVREFISGLSPDMVVARCKTIIKEEVFSIPPDGTLVLHPGICPEYRNAHGCFWALANNDFDNVGMTLLKIDAGVDTGPVYGYYTYPYDMKNETPAIIHNRVVYDNLNALQDKLLQIHAGVAVEIDTSGRQSGVWGQPWLSKYLKIKRVARKQ
jgi:folate-dependent phosphoribosylglycinamide formyltransferase PurN